MSTVGRIGLSFERTSVLARSRGTPAAVRARYAEPETPCGHVSLYRGRGRGAGKHRQPGYDVSFTSRNESTPLQRQRFRTVSRVAGRRGVAELVRWRTTADRPDQRAPAPTLSSPQDDAVATGRPTLIVNNRAARAGGRTHVRLSGGRHRGRAQRAAGRALCGSQRNRRGSRRAHQLRSQSRPPERARDTTGIPGPSKAGRAGPWSGTFRFRTEFAGNGPPVIQSITASSRAESSAEIEVSAVVQDLETNPASLVYEWAATGGTVTGSGASVRWRVPGVSVPDGVRADAHRHRAVHRGGRRC